jgi:aspartate kinase
MPSSTQMRIVMKFGGTSMAGIERIRSVAERVRREAESGNQVLVVVSAMAGETDRLVQLCREAAPLHNRQEYDVVVASGEQVTSGLLAMTLQAAGLNARSFMGWQLVRASGVHGNARVEAVESALLDEALSAGTVAVIPGFQGVSADGRLATLGRGGSDTSAVAIAAGLKADRCDIYTDVDGVYTTDPRIVPRARKLNQVTFEEMLELAGVGAKVLQVRSVGMAMRENLPLRVLSAFEDLPGTDIVTELSGAEMERNLIAGIAADRNEARVTLTGVPDQPGTVAQVIAPLAEAGIQVDMIVHAATPNTGSSDLTFTVPRASLAQALSVIEQCQGDIGYAGLVHDDAVAKVSIVGVGIRSNPQLAAKMFEVLAERQINLLAVSSSEIKVSALISETELELAVRVLHTAFGLDQPDSRGQAA